MTYLILHSVRGQPAFDVAEKMRCPVCEPARQGLDYGQDYAGNCDACDDGFWWVIPTSGHRAYPYWHSPLTEFQEHLLADSSLVPKDWPDHYATPDGNIIEPKINIGSLLSKLVPKIKRRI